MRNFEKAFVPTPALQYESSFAAAHRHRGDIGCKTNFILHRKDGTVVYQEDPTVYDGQTWRMLVPLFKNHDGRKYRLDQSNGGDDYLATGLDQNGAFHMVEVSNESA